MPESVAFLIAGILLIVLLVVVARHAAYRESHVYTLDDLQKARREAIVGSQRTRGGQAAEQIAPLLPAFCDRFNPKDAHFLGKPIDFVVFDGLEEGELRRIVFLEIKSGARNDLNKNEKEIRRVVAARDIEFEVLNPLR